jgi:hypothetical protein
LGCWEGYLGIWMNRRMFGRPIGQDNYTRHWTIQVDAYSIGFS